MRSVLARCSVTQHQPVTYVFGTQTQTKNSQLYCRSSGTISRSPHEHTHSNDRIYMSVQRAQELRRENKVNNPVLVFNIPKYTKARMNRKRLKRQKHRPYHWCKDQDQILYRILHACLLFVQKRCTPVS